MTVTLQDGNLRLPMQRTSEEVCEPEYVFDRPLVRFAAYQADHRLFGWVRLDASRLTDLLNAFETICLENVEVADFERGSIRSIDQIIVPRDELIAVHASGPRGDESQRRPTRSVPLTVSSGSYVISGRLHAVAGIDPLENLRERGPLVPLTDACIEYWIGEERAHRSTGTIIFNRDRADRIQVLDATRSRRPALGRSPGS